MSVRVLTPEEDRVVYERFVIDVHPHFEGYILGALPRATTLTGLFAPIASPGARALVAVVAVLHQPAAHEVLDVAVRPQARRRGHARALLTEVVDAAHAAGQPVWLEVRADNHSAIALYKTLGFVSTGTRKAYYRAARGVPVDAILMARATD